MLSFKALALWVEIWLSRPGPHANMAKFENTVMNREMFEMGAVSASGRHQAAIKRTVNRILLIKWILRGAGDGNRTRTISLGSSAVRACHMP